VSEPRPLIICAPEPRSIGMLFTPRAKSRLYERYRIVEVEPSAIGQLSPAELADARYVLGQPPMDARLLGRMGALRAIFNVEGNFLANLDYETLFASGIHVLTTSSVFAGPVAEMGLGLALSLARGIIDADLDFRNNREIYGAASNTNAKMLGGSDIGIIGFGDLGRALNERLSGFGARIKAHDPWLPPAVLRHHNVVPATLDEVLGQSDFIFVLASATADNQGFLGAPEFARMRRGAALIVLSRAAVVDFGALVAAVRSGHIVAASDVFPQEPLARGHPVRTLKGFVCSAHRAGAIDIVFTRMGDMVLDDMELMDRGLPPQVCKRAERETVSRMRSKAVEKS
jgi:phosphoglycerate dehydrogenase-like enzyme